MSLSLDEGAAVREALARMIAAMVEARGGTIHTGDGEVVCEWHDFVPTPFGPMRVRIVAGGRGVSVEGSRRGPEDDGTWRDRPPLL